jgi:hypothetical protein
MTNQILISQFVKKAQGLSEEQKKSILETHAKISTWVKNHPNETVSADTVPEILETRVEKPKEELEKMFEPVSPAPSLQAAALKIAETHNDFGLNEAKQEPIKPAPLVRPQEITHCGNS